MIFIGIDPGKKGSMAIIDGKGEAAPMVIPFKEITWIDALKMLDAFHCRAVVEKVGAMPGQGVTSMFNFGMNFGWIQGVLDALNISYELVSPQKWKKEFGLTSDKSESIRTAQRLFPGVSLKTGEKSRVESDGMAEALLIAEYARSKLGGE